MKRNAADNYEPGGTARQVKTICAAERDGKHHGKASTF